MEGSSGCCPLLLGHPYLILARISMSHSRSRCQVLQRFPASIIMYRGADKTIRRDRKRRCLVIYPSEMEESLTKHVIDAWWAYFVLSNSLDLFTLVVTTEEDPHNCAGKFLFTAIPPLACNVFSKELDFWFGCIIQPPVIPKSKWSDWVWEPILQRFFTLFCAGVSSYSLVFGSLLCDHATWYRVKYIHFSLYYFIFW